MDLLLGIPSERPQAESGFDCCPQLRDISWNLGTLAIEEQAHDRELFAAYCMGVFGPDQSSLKSPSMPACLTNEPAE